MHYWLAILEMGLTIVVFVVWSLSYYHNDEAPPSRRKVCDNCLHNDHTMCGSVNCTCWCNNDYL